MREHGRGQGGSKLVAVGRVLVAIAAIFFGVENFLHTANVPGVPARKPFVHLRFRRTQLIGYLTGVILFVARRSYPGWQKTRMAATYLGTWLVLVVLFIYGPILIAALGGSEHRSQN